MDPKLLGGGWSEFVVEMGGEKGPHLSSLRTSVCGDFLACFLVGCEASAAEEVCALEIIGDCDVTRSCDLAVAASMSLALLLRYSILYLIN